MRGKLLGQPVSTLLGGRRRERVKVYATGLYFTGGEDLLGKLVEEARLYAAQGFRAIKMKVGLGVETDVRHARAVRQALGDDVELMVDANHAYSLSEAVNFARRIEALGISFFEEPLSPEDYEGYRELRGRTTIPIAGGECEYLLAGFRQLLGGRCVDIAQPDICAAGGLSEVMRIAALARAFHVNVIPHSWGTGIAFAAGFAPGQRAGCLARAAAHAGAAAGDGPLGESPARQIDPADISGGSGHSGGAECAGLGRGCGHGGAGRNGCDKRKRMIPLADIQAASQRLDGIVARSPLLRLPLEEAPCDIYLKLENLQPIGSFKLRGAGNAMALAGRDALAQGVYTASAGNMAQGVAWSARRLGIPCQVIVPNHAPATKLAAIERLGGRVIKVPFERWWEVIVSGEFAWAGGLLHPPSQRPGCDGRQWHDWAGNPGSPARCRCGGHSIRRRRAELRHRFSHSRAEAADAPLCR